MPYKQEFKVDWVTRYNSNLLNLQIITLCLNTYDVAILITLLLASVGADPAKRCLLPSLSHNSLPSVRAYPAKREA
jgi:hypothetical protein